MTSKREPSDYNKFMKMNIAMLKEEDPELGHKEAFIISAKEWKNKPTNTEQLKRISMVEDIKNNFLKHDIKDEKIFSVLIKPTLTYKGEDSSKTFIKKNINNILNWYETIFRNFNEFEIQDMDIALGLILIKFTKLNEDFVDEYIVDPSNNFHYPLNIDGINYTVSPKDYKFI